jgi:hypothetical protein
MMMRPLVGVSSPPNKCSIVDLPHPDGPITATFSALRIATFFPVAAADAILFVCQCLHRIKIRRAHRRIKRADRATY